MKLKLLFVIGAILLSILPGCYYDKKEDLYSPQGGGVACDTASVTYSGKIQPIMTASCVGCHSAGNASGGFSLDTHAGVSAASGRLLGAVKHSTGFSAMPKNSNKLSDCQITQIEKWLTSGAPND